jgi:alpha-ketoglutaric semialdehyde dehydrogenase
MELTGRSLIAGRRAPSTTKTFHATAPATGAPMDPPFWSATLDDLALAVDAAEQAFPLYAKASGATRAHLLRTIAKGLEDASASIVERAHLETGLPLPRLQGEVVRTSNQLRLFADVVAEGAWVDARIDTALPDRTPLPRPDLRSMLFPLGPVAVFGASNFPIAFSVAGGDTASALAAGNPVIIKAHPAHPGTSEIVGSIIAAAVAQCGLPAGIFSLLFDAGIEIGQALVTHPAIAAIGFTGSHRAGRALMDLAASRKVPIPCFTEMSSTNPVFVLPQALRDKPEPLATALHQSFTLGAGQFCTKPGIVFLPALEGSEPFLARLRELTEQSAAFTMLTPGIALAYRSEISRRGLLQGIRGTSMKDDSAPCGTTAVLFETEIDHLHAHQGIAEEIFGPSLLVVHYRDRDRLLEEAHKLDGHLTATILGSDQDLADATDLIAILERKVGRLIFNGYPTGVEVSHAMVHGGPYPATSDSRFTSVGSQAILRFVRPRCYQNFPSSTLPPELQDGNPLGILRMTNGTIARG